MTGPVTLDRRADGVAVVTVDHAASRMNTLAGHVVEALHDAARELTAAPPGAVVLTGRPTLFSAGAESRSSPPPRPARSVTGSGAPTRRSRRSRG